MDKFYYVTFQGRNNPKEIKEDQFGNVEEDLHNQLKSLSFITGSMIIHSKHFMPDYFMDVIKNKLNCEIVSIMNVIPLTKEDMEANTKYLEMIEAKNKLPDTITDEIDRLVGLTQEGNLRVIVDENSEKIIDEDDMFSADDDIWKKD